MPLDYTHAGCICFRFSRLNDLVIIQTSQGLAEYVRKAYTMGDCALKVEN